MDKKQTLRVGDRVQVCIGSGIDSECKGTIVSVGKEMAMVSFDGLSDSSPYKRRYMDLGRLIKEGESWRPKFV